MPSRVSTDLARGILTRALQTCTSSALLDRCLYELRVEMVASGIVASGPFCNAVRKVLALAKRRKDRKAIKVLIGHEYY